MKKLILCSSIIVIVCLLISFVVIPVMSKNNPVNNSVGTSVAETESIYIVKSENDRIVVYEKGQAAPVKTTDTVVSVLPKQDQEYLYRGIEVSGEDSLRKLLEDYCS